MVMVDEAGFMISDAILFCEADDFLRVVGPPTASNWMQRTLTAALFVGALAASQTPAAENLTAMTSGPGTAVHLTIAHLEEVASERGLADIQITPGQTGANATQAVAEGRTGICPFTLPFLMSKGVGPYAAMGAKKGAELAANLRILHP